MSQDELRAAYERRVGSQGGGLLAAARRQVAREWLGGSVEGLTAAQVEAVLELACNDRACAPPPVGRGGSLPAGWRKGAEMLEDDDSGELMPHLSTSSVGFLGVDNSEDHHDRWEQARDRFRSSTEILSGGATHDELVAWQGRRQVDIVATYGHKATVGPGEVYASQVHVREPDLDSPLHSGKPIAVSYGGKTYVMDGHHRIVSKWAKGEKAEIDVVDLDRLEAAVTAAAEELACHDASCAPPPVGTGGSRAGGGVGASRSKEVADVVLYGTSAERVALAESLYNQQLPLGYSSAIEASSFEGGILSHNRSLHMEGTIRDPNNSVVGHFERSIDVKAHGVLVVGHDTLVIDPNHHGMGIAQAFTEQAITEYRKVGVERVEVLAAMEVGAFAWARQDYRFPATADGEELRKYWVEERLQWVKKLADVGAENRWSQDDARQMKKSAQDLINASNRGEQVQPIHVASLGEDRFRWTGTASMLSGGHMREQKYDTWPGKEVLLNWNQGNPQYGDPSWSGVRYLANERVAASAETEEFYSPTQPRAADGTWTRTPFVVKNPAKTYVPRTLISEIRIKGYEGEDLNRAEAYKFHGPRHVADSMDPNLRKDVTADLLNRKAVNDPEWKDIHDHARDTGLYGSWGVDTPTSLGLVLQAAHLHEFINAPDFFAGRRGWEMVDKIQDVIARHTEDPNNRRTHDALYEITGVDATTGLLGAINRSWQVSASDTIAVAAHLTVAKTHGLDNAVDAMGDYMKDDRVVKAQAVLGQIGESNMKAITDTTYAVTQQTMSELYGDKPIRIWRGVEDPMLTSGGWVQPSPLSSWSTSQTTAEGFAGRAGAVMYMDQKWSNVYSVASVNGLGSLKEQEVVVLGHDYDVGAYRISDAADDYAAKNEDRGERILIDDPAVSDPDWIRTLETRRERAALTAALKASTLKTTTN